MNELTTELSKMEVELTINATGKDEAFKALDLVLAIPLVEITSEEQYKYFENIYKSFEFTEKGVSQGALPTLKRIINEIKEKTGVLATLEDYAKRGTTFKNNIEKMLKGYVANRFNIATQKTWDDMALQAENLEVKRLCTFENFKEQVANATKGMSSEEKKLDKLELVAEEFKNWITSKDKEVSLIKKAITDKVKIIYQDEIKRLVNVDVDLATNLSMIDDFVAKKEALEVALAEEEAKRQAELEAKKAEQDALEQAKKELEEQEKAIKTIANATGIDLEDKQEVAKKADDKVVFEDIEANKKIIYYSDDLKAELNAIFAKYAVKQYLDGVLIERRD